MTIPVELAFAQYLDAKQVAGLYVNLFVSQLPAKNGSDDNQWAVVAYGGTTPSGGNVLLWRRTVNLRVMYRHKDRGAIGEADIALQSAVEALRSLASGPVLSASVTPLTDTDTDPEGRHTAYWTVAIDTTT